MSAPEPTNVSEAMRPVRKYLAQGKQLDQIGQHQVAYLCMFPLHPIPMFSSRISQLLSLP